MRDPRFNVFNVDGSGSNSLLVWLAWQIVMSLRAGTFLSVLFTAVTLASQKAPGT